MTDEDEFAALRARAYELADTSRYADWDAIAVELTKEGAPEVLVTRLGHDGLFKIMLANRIAAANERA
jgi:hypothetical protein